MKIGDIVRLKSDHVDNILVYEVAKVAGHMVQVTILTTGETGGWVSETLMQRAVIADPYAVVCPYCGNPANLVRGARIYPTRGDLASLYLWACDPCDAYVGTHKSSANHVPLGRLANRELRRWKIATHKKFDQVWKENWLTRSEAYAWLSQTLKIDPPKCHIGMFDVTTCEKVIAAVEKRWVRPPAQPD